MAKKTKDQLVEWVIAKIDEVMPDDANGASELLQEAPVGFIEDELDSSADFIIKNAPAELLAPVIKTGEFHATVAPGNAVDSRLVIDPTTLIGFFVLPTDFKRFMSLKISGWQKPIFELMKRDDPRYKLMHNEYRGGTWRKPQGVLIPFSRYAANEINALWTNVGLAVEIFRAKTDSDTVEYFEYIPITTAANMPEELQDPVAWVCASRALQILGKDQESKRAQERAEIQLQFKIGTYRENGK
ncbi:MAG: hypothetical protein VYB44_07090 [Bacteroidota bacterium]|nr:hypothetical protein [Bacteroidota bacterium]